MIVRNLSRLNRVILSTANPSIITEIERAFSESGSDQGTRTTFRRIGQNMNYSERGGSDRRLSDLIESLKFSSSSVDFQGAVATLKSAVNLAKSPADSAVLRNDPNFAKVVETFRSGIASINEPQSLDALYVLRKSSGILQMGMTGADYDAIKERINTMVEQDGFSLRQLSSLYFSFCCLHWQSEKLSKKLISQLGENPTQISDMLATQTILGLCIKSSHISPQDLRLVEIICKNHELYYEQLDYKRKSELFKNLARLELHIHSIKTQLPELCNILKKDLKSNIDKLGEDEVINIVHAYAYLPNNFSNDLIEEFKSMVDITLEQNPANLKSYFLVRYLEGQINLNKTRKLTDSSVEKILNELAVRISNDPFLKSNLYKLIGYCNKLGGVSSKTFTESVQSYMLNDNSSSNNLLKNFQVVEYLFKHNMNISALVERILAHPQVNVTTLRKLKYMLSLNSNQYKDLIKTVEQHPKFDDLDNLHKDNSPSLYGSEDSETAVSFLKKQYEKVNKGEGEDLLPRSFVDNMFKMAHNKKVVSFLLSEELVKISDLPNTKLNYLINRFKEIETPTLTQFRLLLGILQKNKEALYLPKLLDLLIYRQVARELTSKDQSVVAETLRLMKSSKDKVADLNLTEVWRLSKRLDDLNYNDDNVTDLVALVFNNAKKTNMTVEMQVSQMLAHRNSLRLERGVQVLKAISDRYTELPRSMYPVACSVLNNKRATDEDKALAQKFVDSTLSFIDSEMQSADSRKAMWIVSNYLLLPTETLVQNKDRFLSFLKDHIEHVSVVKYIEALRSLPARRIKDNFEVYYPFLKELAAYYPHLANNIKPWQVLEILRVFSSCGLSYPSLYNQILTTLGKYFNLFRTSDLVSIVQCFARLQFKQVDLFDQVINTLLEPENHKKLQRSDLESLIKSFFKVGHDSVVVKANIEKLVGDHMKNGNIAVILVPYLLTLDLPNEAELLDKCFKSISTMKDEKKSADRKHSAQIQEKVYTLLASNYPNKEYAALWNEVTKLNKASQEESSEDDEEKSQDEKSDDEEDSKSTDSLKFIGQLKQYLDLMGVKQTVAPDFGVAAKYFLLTDKNTIVYLLQRLDLNFSKNSLNGFSLLTQRLLKEAAEKQGFKLISFLNPKFLQEKDGQEKVTYICSQGIVPPDGRKTYDFSSLPSRKRTNEKGSANSKDVSGSPRSKDGAKAKAAEEVEAKDETPTN